METKNKLNYEVTSERAYVERFYFSVNFSVDGKEYLATCYYYNGDEHTDYMVEDDKGREVEDDDIYQIGCDLLFDMEITKENLVW